MNRADVLALSDKVVGSATADLEKLFPAKFPACTRIHLDDGRVVERTVVDAPGTAARPFARAELIEKFDVLTNDRLSNGRKGLLLHAIQTIDDSDVVEPLVGLLRACGED